MREFDVRRKHPELKEIVFAASRALAHLDADRLEELALCCKALNRDQNLATQDSASLARQAEEAAGGMAVFGRVLTLTRANLFVLHHSIKAGESLDYGESQSRGWAVTENGHGDN